MDTKAKNEELKFVIGRYDSYYNSVNTKGNFYLTINTFILGGVIAGYFSLDKIYHFGCGITMLFIFTLLANVTAIVFTLLAIRPYLNNRKDNPDGSLLFFGDVAGYHDKHFHKKWNEVDETKWHEDLKKQAQLLAIGLSGKFNKLHYATWAIAVQIVSILVFGLIILNN